MYRFQLHRTLSGQLEHPLVDAEASWTVNLEKGSGGTLSFLVGEQGLGRADIHELTDPTGLFEVACLWDDVVVGSGVIAGRTVWDPASGRMRVPFQHSSDVFFPARLTFGVNRYADGDLSVTNRSYQGAVRAILQRAMWGGPSPAGGTWPLNFDLPADQAGGFTRLWRRWESLTIMSLLDQIRAAGVEISHRDYLDGAGVLRHATVAASPVVVGETVLPYDSPASPVREPSYERDGSDMVTGVSHTGSGTEDDALRAWAGNNATIYPIRDRYAASREITDLAQLQAIADADVAQNGLPTRELGFSVQVGPDLSPADLLPGNVLHLDIYGDPVIPEGRWSHRVKTLRLDSTSNMVTPEGVKYG
jgi:hypothetical protein